MSETTETTPEVSPEATTEIITPIEPTPGTPENPIVEEPDLQEIPEDFDPATQKIVEIEAVENRDGEVFKKTVRTIVDKTPEEIQEEETRAQDAAIASRIRELKYKVAIGTATTNDKSELKLLTA